MSGADCCISSLESAQFQGGIYTYTGDVAACHGMPQRVIPAAAEGCCGCCMQATPHPAVVFMPEGSRTHMGGTMRLGSRRTLLQTVDCITAKLYQV